MKLGSTEYVQSLLGLVQRIISAYMVENSIDVDEAKTLVSSLITEEVLPLVGVACSKKDDNNKSVIVSLIESELTFISSNVSKMYTAREVRGILLRIKEHLKE